MKRLNKDLIIRKMNKKLKVELFKLTIIILILFLNVKCTFTTYLNKNIPEYSITLDSFGNYNIKGKTYYINSGDENISSSDLEFKEYADYLKKSLWLQGAIETSNIKDADMCILINYGISDESYIEIVPEPIWGSTGIQSITTKSNSTKNSKVITTNSESEVNHNYGIIGYNNVEKKIKRFCRVLNIYSYNNKSNDHEMLWKTNINSCGSNNNLRSVLPYMAYVSWRNLGKSSNGSLNYSILENDYIFRCWKGGFLMNPDVVTFPRYQRSSISSYIGLILVERTNEETTLFLRKYNCPDKYSFNKSLYIEYNGKKYNILSAQNYELGSKIKKECGIRYFILTFPSIPNEAKSIDLKDEKNENIEILGIQLK